MCNTVGLTALVKAADKDMHKVVTALLDDHRIDPHLSKHFRGGALHWAAGNGHNNTTKVLLEAGGGARVDVRFRRFHALL